MMNINLEFLIAGALLHDVGKLMEYELKDDGSVVKSEFGKTMRHPVSGSKLAEECGLPNEVVHIIYAHSKEGDTLERSSEAIIVHHCDFIDFEIRKSLV
jgi:putative nucleotidyltransferase with HDIG domain